jgi:putative transposase
MICVSMCCKLQTSILKGLNSFSPGLARFLEGLPWVIAFKFHNPERVEYQTVTTEMQPFRVESSQRIIHLEPMPQSLAKILVHVVFSTKDRRPFLRDKAIREELHRYQGGILNRLDCPPIIVGGVEDHVHFLCALSRTSSAADMVKEAKRGSSLWLKTMSPDLADFNWQNGYRIFSIGFSQIESVREYIAGQEKHHRRVSFQDEFRRLLGRYAIQFDERYVWD